MYFWEIKSGIWDSELKKCGMRDSREKGAGMRDQDPPFQTLLHSSVDRAKHRYREGHGFESRCSLEIISHPVFIRFYKTTTDPAKPQKNTPSNSKGVDQQLTATHLNETAEQNLNRKIAAKLPSGYLLLVPSNSFPFRPSSSS